MNQQNDSHRARKRFGQNFLHDQQIIQRIVSSLRAKPGDRVVEIGPGLGALTQPLIDIVGKIDVVEIDRDLVARLQQHYSPEVMTIHSHDALKFDFHTLVTAGEKLRIIGNLPYNISTPLLFHLMEQLDVVQDIHCMLQKEVVERMAAKPGDSAYGRLSIMLQYHCDVVKLFNVGPGAFHPAPKVDSAVARLTPHTTKPTHVNDEKIFSKVVNQAFSQRRKTLRNCLKTLLSTEQIESCNIDPTARPETLSLSDFAKLSNITVDSPDTSK